jgi:alkaline phosphatase
MQLCILYNRNQIKPDNNNSILTNQLTISQMNRTKYFLIAFLTLAFIPISQQNASETRVKNIILLIGDGMSFAHIQAGILASETPLHIEQFRHIGFIHTSSADNFVTDSGAAGTALASGVKTNNGFIGMDPDSNAVKSILHISGKNGRSTGVVVSCAVTHATPAAFVAHQPSRNMVEEIALDFLDAPIDVFIGGGKDHFTKRRDSRNLLEDLEAQGFSIAVDMDEARRVTSGRLAALVAPNHPPKYIDGRGDLLPQGTKIALDLLSQDEGGFFLMVEGSQIDWGGHDNDVKYVIGEVLDFDRAIGKALDFARKDGETLVIVTSDHDTGGMGIHGFDPETRTVRAGWTTTGHTGLMQPVFAWGPGAEEFTGIYENTGIFDRMLEAFGFSRN